MRPSCSWAYLLTLLTASRLASADGLADFSTLRESITSKSASISTLANSTAPANDRISTTQGFLTELITQLGTAQQNVQADQTSWTNGQKLPLDDPYLDMVNPFLSLANSLTALGKSPHPQNLNQQIVNALAAVEDQFHTYASYIYDRNIISRSSWIRSLTAMSALASAEGQWNAGSGNGTQATKRSNTV